MAKFREFLRKFLLADTDYLVGHDADGRYIRISRDDLAASVAANTAAPTLKVQYSVSGDSWHDSYVSGDHYVRIKAGSGAWSNEIALCVSAYDIWRQRNAGNEDDFLRSLKGEVGAGADLSGLQLRDIRGYAEFLQDVNAAIANASASIINNVKTAVLEEMQTALADKLDKDLSNLDRITYMGDNASVLVIAQDGTLKRVYALDMASYTGIKNRVENSAVEAAFKSQRKTIAITGTQDGSNRTYNITSGFTPGTSAVYLNGSRLYAGTDYREDSAYQITFLTWIPSETDNILFEAIPLSGDNTSQTAPTPET